MRVLLLTVLLLAPVAQAQRAVVRLTPGGVGLGLGPRPVAVFCRADRVLLHFSPQPRQRFTLGPASGRMTGSVVAFRLSSTGFDRVTLRQTPGQAQAHEVEVACRAGRAQVAAGEGVALVWRP